VVAGEHQQHGVIYARLGRLSDQAELQRQFLDAAERARRLGLAVDPRTQRGLMRAIERRDVGVRPLRGIDHVHVLIGRGAVDRAFAEG
jgi:ribosomal protein L13E